MKKCSCHRVHRRKLLTALGLLLALAASACAVERSPPAATPAAPTPAEATTPMPRPPGWEAYATPVSVPQPDISRITIDYAWVGWGERQLAWVIERTDDAYHTEQGASLDPALVTALGSSLTNLRRSGGLKTCEDHTDDYPEFKIDLSLADGSQVTLLSDANCPQNVPWNVLYDGALYVQYTGEIPAALHPLFEALVDDPEQQDLIDVQGNWLGFPFAITGGELPPGVEQTGFSEKALHLHILTGSPLYAPFASEYEVGDLVLFCAKDAPQHDCSAIEGTLTLNARDGGMVLSLPVSFQGLELTRIGLGAQEARDIGQTVSQHALTQRVRSQAPDATLRMSCSRVSPCDEGRYYPPVYASLGLAAPSECSPCAIRFEGWDVYHDFVYFPDLEQMWVQGIHFGFSHFQDNRDVLDLDSLLALYRTPDHETLVDEHIFDFEIQACGRMMVHIEPGVLEANPDYVPSLEEDAQSFENRIDIHGYCVFVNTEGQSEPRKQELTK